MNYNLLLKIFKWTGRTLSILCIGFILMFLIGEGYSLLKPGIRVIILHLFFPIGVITGMIISWFKEGFGGAITIASLCDFYILNLILYGKLPKGPWFLIISSPGIIFLIYWILLKKIKFTV